MFQSSKPIGTKGILPLYSVAFWEEGYSLEGPPSVVLILYNDIQQGTVGLQLVVSPVVASSNHGTRSNI
jgi:hypothetical protein